MSELKTDGLVCGIGKAEHIENKYGTELAFCGPLGDIADPPTYV